MFWFFFVVVVFFFLFFERVGGVSVCLFGRWGGWSLYLEDLVHFDKNAVILFAGKVSSTPHNAIMFAHWIKKDGGFF